MNSICVTAVVVADAVFVLPGVASIVAIASAVTVMPAVAFM
jgi:hypothetical protein